MKPLSFVPIFLMLILPLNVHASYSLDELCKQQAEQTIYDTVGEGGEYSVTLVDEVTVGQEVLQEYEVIIDSINGYDCDSAECQIRYQISYSTEGGVCEFSEPVELPNFEI